MFEGTPQNVRVPNLQKPLGRPRDPFLAPAGVVNVAKGKTVDSSDMEPIIGELAQVTDGDKKGADGSYVELGPGAQHVTIDLGAPHEVFAVLFWHFHRQARVYLDVIVQVADDAAFTKNVRTLFNNDHDNSSGLGAGHGHELRRDRRGQARGREGTAAPATCGCAAGATTPTSSTTTSKSRSSAARRSRKEPEVAGDDEKDKPAAPAEPAPEAARSARRAARAFRPCPRSACSATRSASSARTSATQQQAAEAARPAPPADLQEINVALLGAGAQGQVLLDAMLRIPGLRFRAVCDIWTEFNQRRVVNTLKKYKFDVRGYEDYRQMLDEEKELDAVVIATPDFWHAPHAIDCLRAGKHVYCEKEMSNTLEGARSMVLAARETGKLLQIGHQRRSHPRYLHCREKLIGEAGILGRIVTVNGQWNRAVAPDLGAPERYTIPAGEAQAVRLRLDAAVPQLALVQGQGRRPDRRPRLAPDRHLQLVPGHAARARDGERRPRLPRPEDARVVRHGDGDLRVRDEGGAGAGLLPDPDHNGSQGYFETFMGDQGTLVISESEANYPGASTATRTPPPGTSGSAGAGSRRRSCRRAKQRGRARPCSTSASRSRPTSTACRSCCATRTTSRTSRTSSTPCGARRRSTAPPRSATSRPSRC